MQTLSLVDLYHSHTGIAGSDDTQREYHLDFLERTLLLTVTQAKT